MTTPAGVAPRQGAVGVLFSARRLDPRWICHLTQGIELQRAQWQVDLGDLHSAQKLEGGGEEPPQPDAGEDAEGDP
jgi:hypothetical protein